jgi:signal transduction histidine kinase
MVDIIEDDGGLRREAIFHRDREREALVRQLEDYNTRPPESFGRRKVVRTGRAELYVNVTDELLQAVAQDGEHLRILRQLNFKSFMCVPLTARGRLLGTASFVRDEGAPYESGDLALAEDLAGQAALAVDNAMLYKREQEANRVKDEFLARVSHELRTPLTPIFGAAYVLRSHFQGCQHNDRIAAAIEVVDRNARAQARMIEDLLDISRISSDRFELHRCDVDILHIVNSVLEHLGPAAASAGVQVETALETPARPVYCDPGRINQVLSGIISNAIRFTPQGGRIKVSLRNRPDGVRLRVEDTGVGIDSRFLPHVFERFRQADQFSTRSQGGLGLGLSIARYIVERHGGAIHAESPGKGQGSAFTVDLPFS